MHCSLKTSGVHSSKGMILYSITSVDVRRLNRAPKTLVSHGILKYWSGSCPFKISCAADHQFDTLDSILPPKRADVALLPRHPRTSPHKTSFQPSPYPPPESLLHIHRPLLHPLQIRTQTTGPTRPSTMEHPRILLLRIGLHRRSPTDGLVCL